MPTDFAPGRGRPPMTERRKEIVRMEIARAAVTLFTENGVANTTGEDIAHALGMSPRTLWRYFPTKESCVRPLLTSGLALMAERLCSCPYDVALLDHLQREGAFVEDVWLTREPVADLVRMTQREPGLMAVWLEVHHTAESTFAEIIADRTGASPDDLAVRVQAATLNATLRLAAEEQARYHSTEQPPPTEGMGELVRAALTAATRGLPAFQPEYNVESAPGVEPASST